MITNACMVVRTCLVCEPTLNTRVEENEDVNFRSMHNIIDNEPDIVVKCSRKQSMGPKVKTPLAYHPIILLTALVQVRIAHKEQGGSSCYTGTH